MNQEGFSRNIVICSDGTGNTFDESVSNVTRLIQHIELSRNQTVVYDQGIGTNSQRLQAVAKYCDGLDGEAGKALIKLEGPSASDCISLALGLAFGYGLKDNVREIYRQLSDSYLGPSDGIFLFGFSRGAFTVRAVAGLIYRCGLPAREMRDFDAFFETAWQLYQPHRKDTEALDAFHAKYGPRRHCEIHCLGLWDTVKSYGGLNPISLPHLRHNPIVRHIRHALALDEKRSWFNATTWGQLDLDEKGAGTRLEKDGRYATQDIKEVWFRGCHSDVGGGDAEEATARIPLRWMLAESKELGLRLSARGKNLIDAPEPTEAPAIHESDNAWWKMADLIPRLEIDNSGQWPAKKWRVGKTGIRNPMALPRKKTVFLHESAAKEYSVARLRDRQPHVERAPSVQYVSADRPAGISASG